MQLLNRLLTLLLLFIMAVNGLTQNLIPNGDFEQYTSCPDNASQIDRATGWNTYSESPDYFHTCSPSSNYSTPNNIWGYQIPATGSAYSGAYFFTNIPSNTREIIGVQLSSPLIIGQKYYISFKVSLTLYPTILNAACNNLGALFSTISYSDTNPIPLNNFAHVYTTSIITDTVNWSIVSGSFISDSAYQYLAIGNFFDDLNTNYIPYDSSGVYTAYYYIDDVCVSIDSLICNLETSMVENQFKNKLLIFPNPTRDRVTIKINEHNTNDFHIEIYNSIGIKLKQFHKSDSEEIDISELPTGIYFVKASFLNQTYIQKLIIY